MAEPNIPITPTLISWILGALGSLILFFLGLGAKDIKDKMRKVDQQCVELARLKGELSGVVAELRGEIKVIHQRLDSERLEWSGKK